VPPAPASDDGTAGHSPEVTPPPGQPRLGKWTAERQDTHETLRADSAEELRDKIVADYTARPVPRDLPSRPRRTRPAALAHHLRRRQIPQPVTLQTCHRVKLLRIRPTTGAPLLDER
jgi:hypothetical protein